MKDIEPITERACLLMFAEVGFPIGSQFCRCPGMPAMIIISSACGC